MKKLLVATQNQGKVAEFADMLDDLSLTWLGLADLNITDEVEETGRTFEENAILKAKAYASRSGLLTLADDSGLEVDALGGAPGVYTARYGDSSFSHKQRYEFLLQNLQDVPEAKRTARFRSVIAVVGADGELLGTAEGVCEGRIAFEPKGSHGFGYDPVFYLPEKEVTMAQLLPQEKHKISHRGRAIRQIAPLLRKLTRESS